MFYYIFVFAVTTFLGIFIDSINKYCCENPRFKVQRAWATFTIILIYLIFIGCRSLTVGADTPVYVLKIQNASTATYYEYIAGFAFVEPIFYSYVWLCSRVSSSPSFFFIVSALFYIIVFYKLIKRYSNSVGWSLWIINSMGFATMALSTVRQSMAIAICILSYMYLEKNKWKSCLLYIVAVCTHVSSAIFLPMLFVPYLSKKNVVFTMSLLLVSAVLLGRVFMGSLAGYYQLVTGKYGGESMDAEGVGGMGMIVFLSLLLIMGATAYFPKKIGIDTSKYNEFIAICLALAVFIVSRSNLGMMRLYWYYLSIAVLYIPNVLHFKKGVNKHVWQLAVFAITLFFLVTQVMSDPYDEASMLLPYRFFWN